MEIKYIFFDMGNTLIHYHKCGPSDEEKDQIGLNRMAKYLSNIFLIEIKTQDLSANFFNPWMSVFPKRVTELREFPIDQFLDPFVASYGKAMTESQKIEALKIQSSEFQKFLWIEPKLDTLLCQLNESEHKIGVISNSAVYDEVNIDHFNYLGIKKYFSTFTFSYSLGFRKPRQEIFYQAIEQLKANPEKSLMVGDSLTADIAGAQMMGMKTAWYNPDKVSNSSKIRPDIVLNNLHEIKNYLRGQ